MTIYRFQTSDGKGAYRNNTGHCPINRGEHQPSPYGDRKLEDKWRSVDVHYWKFGFKDIKQVNKWFTKKDQKKMALFGVHLYKIEIKKVDVMVGSTQIVYRWDKILSCKKVRSKEIK